MKRILIVIIILFLLLVTACEVNVFDFAKSIDRETLEDTESFSESVSKNDELDIKIKVGDIKIETGDSDNLEIEVKKKVKSFNKITAEKILDNIEIDINRTKKGIEIRALTKESGSMDIWEWKNSRYKTSEIVIDLEIKVPPEELKYEIEGNVGVISLKNLIGQFDIVTNVGNIDLNKLVLKDKNYFETNVGEFDIKNLDIRESKNMSFITNVGRIYADFEETDFSDTSCNRIELSTDVGTINLSLSENYKIIKNNQKTVKHYMEIKAADTEIILSSDVGEIDIENR
jgi:hypothetical protein